MASELRETIPTFGGKESEGDGEVDITNWSALTSTGFASNWRDVFLIVGVAVLILGGAELFIRLSNVKSYIFPLPSAVFATLVTRFPDLFWPHMQVTLIELLSGFAIGATIGIVLAAVITQFPLVEKIIMPPVGLVTGRVDFNQLKVVLQKPVLGPDGKEVVKEVAIGYGAALQSLFELIIVAAVVFLIVRAYNRFRTVAAAEPHAQEKLLTEIRALMKEQVQATKR